MIQVNNDNIQHHFKKFSDIEYFIFHLKLWTKENKHYIIYIT